MANFFDQFDTGAADAQMPKQNFFDQFETPPAETAQGTAAPSRASGGIGGESAASPETPPAGGNFFDQFDAPSVANASTQASPRTGFLEGARRSFWQTTLEQNPDLGAEALEGFGKLAPEGIRETFDAGSRWMRDIKRTTPETERPDQITLRQLWESGGDGALTWLGNALGSGVASTVPSMATGAAGAVGGGALAGPVGSVVGGTAGAALSGYPMSFAEVYKELKKNGVEATRAAEVARMAAVPMAALDSIPAFWGLTKVFGSQVRQHAGRILAHRLAVEGGKGASLEGLTETAQDTIKKISLAAEAGVPFWSEDNAWDLAESFGSGFVTGGALGGATAIQRDQVAPVPPTQEQIQQVHTDISSAKKGGVGAQLDVEGSQVTPVPKEEPAPTGRAPGEATVDSSQQSLLGPVPPINEPVFYSQVAKTAREKLPDSFTAEQMLGTLRNTPGIKEEELLWLRVPEFAARDGRISKRELLEHLEENAINVEDVTYGGASTFDANWQAHPPARTVTEDGSLVEGLWEAANAPGWMIEQTRNTNAAGQDTVDFEVYDPNGKLAYYASDLPQAQGWVSRHLAPPDQTMYSSWQAVKGGENYRETLLKLPSLTPPRPVDGFASTQEARDYNTADQANYYSPHWEPANVLAHYRTADFQDVTGKRGMLVQEIQSDWHQKGRKTGYRSAFDASQQRIIKAEKSTIAAAQTYGPDHATTNERRLAWLDEQTRHDREFKGSPVPDAPFKTNWAELAVKRILRDAADRGYERVYFSPGRLHAEMYRQQGENAAGQVEFYDKILPRIVEKWARKLNGKTGRTEVYTANSVDGSNTVTEDVFYIDLTPQMSGAVQQGLPMFSMYKLTDVMKRATKEGYVPPRSPAMDSTGQVDFTPSIEATARIVSSVAKDLGISAPVFVRVGNPSENPMSYGMYNPWHYPDGRFAAHVITVYPNNMTHETNVYSTVMHEFGHAIQKDKFDKADSMTQLLVLEEYSKYRQEMTTSNVSTMADVFARRDNFLMQNAREEHSPQVATIDPRKLLPERREYWLGFEEWFAENVARWMTTDAKALNKVERLFASIARALRKMYEMFQARTGWTADVNEQVRGFLEALEHQQLSLAASIEATKQKTQRQNQRALDAAGYSDHPASEATVTTAGARDVLMGAAQESLMGPSTQAQGRASVAIADNFSKWYKWGLSVIQIAERNPHIRSLFTYKELSQQKTLERQIIMDEALRTIKKWRKLSREQADALSGLIDDYMNMRYRTPQEVATNVSRMPTQAELGQLVTQNKVGAEAFALFGEIQQSFLQMLDRYEAVLRQDAMKIVDPAAQTAKLASIQSQFATLRQQPYFPAMRFGDLTLEVRDAAGNLVEFFTFESKRARGKALDLMRTKYPQSAGYSHKINKLPESAGPFTGIPPAFLDLIERKLNLSLPQRDALELLRFEMAPSHSFKHRFERKNRTPGYSLDFQRSFANYFFHGSNHLTRIKYLDAMRQVVKDLRDESRAMLDGEKRQRIADVVEDHLNYELNPRADWSTLRAITFLWYLGFSVASATLNMTQVAVGSYPMLASGFGDINATRALLNAIRKIGTYYKKGTISGLAATDIEMRALDEAVKEGVIDEAQAPELAALSEGSNLQGSVSGHIHRKWIHLMEVSAAMFQATEKWNRRVTFRAAFQLALEQPRAKYVIEAIQKNTHQYDRLLNAGWAPRHAAAFVTAKQATESTQYIYGQYAQPRMMRGKMRTILIFQSFVQNTLFMLWNNPTVAIRSILVMAVLGGFMGLPGMEDLKGIIKLIGKRVFGAQWDLDDEIRKFLIEHVGGEVAPDLVLHGLSRFGMGVPTVMDWVGLPAPTVDMSRSIGMGRVLPIDLNAAFGGGMRPERNMLDTVQRGSGASFSIAFNIWKAINDSQTDLDSLARVQKALPRFAQGIARSYQAFNEGAILNRQGNPVIRFDPQDTRQMMEILAMAGGYQPLRLTAKWDRVMAEKEAIEFWDLRRNGLLRQFWSATQSGSADDRDRVRESIRRYNEMLPDAAKGKAITSDTLRRSVDTRRRLQSLQEQGLPAQKSNVGIVQEIQRLHPLAEVDIRPVR